MSAAVGGKCYGLITRRSLVQIQVAQFFLETVIPKMIQESIFGIKLTLKEYTPE